jgi:Tfp pilus assembly protein PilP
MNMTRIAKTLATLAAVAIAFCGVPRLSAQQPNAQNTPANAQKPAANAQKPAANTQKPPANAPKPMANGPKPTPHSPKPMANSAKPMANAANAPKPGQAATAQKTPSAAHAKAAKPEGLKAGPPNTAATAKAVKPVPAVAKPEGRNSEATELVASKRDPFSPLVEESHGSASSGDHLPPGKAGLVISTVRIDGAVKSPTGMIAVLTNPEQRVYFVREGDHLYDGDVEKISLDGITFRESSRDAFGKPVERLVTKRIYPSAGEQQ